MILFRSLNFIKECLSYIENSKLNDFVPNIYSIWQLFDYCFWDNVNAWRRTHLPCVYQIYVLHLNRFGCWHTSCDSWLNAMIIRWLGPSRLITFLCTVKIGFVFTVKMFEHLYAKFNFFLFSSRGRHLILNDVCERETSILMWIF